MWGILSSLVRSSDLIIWRGRLLTLSSWFFVLNPGMARSRQRCRNLRYGTKTCLDRNPPGGQAPEESGWTLVQGSGCVIVANPWNKVALSFQGMRISQSCCQTAFCCWRCVMVDTGHDQRGRTVFEQWFHIRINRSAGGGISAEVLNLPKAGSALFRTGILIRGCVSVGGSFLDGGCVTSRRQESANKVDPTAEKQGLHWFPKSGHVRSRRQLFHLRIDK